MTTKPNGSEVQSDIDYCMSGDCGRKIKDKGRIAINGQPLNLCDKHILDFIRKTNTKLRWGNPQ
jgi:hypothetical protein